MIFLSCGDTDDGKGFYATIEIVNADSSLGDTYIFKDPDANGYSGGFNNQLDFTATQKNRQSPDNYDHISFNYSLWGEGSDRLRDIPFGGVKLPIGTVGEDESFVIIGYTENCVKGPVASKDIIDSVESNSYLTIYSFEETGEMQHLLVGSIQCKLLLKDKNKMIIEGNFSIPIEVVW